VYSGHAKTSRGRKRYCVRAHDVERVGFRTIEMDELVVEDNVREGRRYLTDPVLGAAAECNYLILRAYYSYRDPGGARPPGRRHVLRRATAG